MKPFTFIITSSNCYLILGIKPKVHFDVRLNDCQVVLKSARLKAESPAQLIVDLTFTFTGGCAVTNGMTKIAPDPDTGLEFTRQVAQ